eukprot:PhF_6_TR11532/c0_g1_i1/m.18488
MSFRSPQSSTPSPSKLTPSTDPSVHIPWTTKLHTTRGQHPIKFPPTSRPTVNAIQGEVDTIASLFREMSFCCCAEVAMPTVTARLQRCIENILHVVADAHRLALRAHETLEAESERMADAMERSREVIAVLKDRADDLEMWSKRWRPTKKTELAKTPGRESSVPRSAPPIRPSTLYYVAPSKERSPTPPRQDCEIVPSRSFRMVDLLKPDRTKAFIPILLKTLVEGDGVTMARIIDMPSSDLLEVVDLDAHDAGFGTMLDPLLKNIPSTVIMFNEFALPNVIKGRCLHDRTPGIVEAFRSHFTVTGSAPSYGTSITNILKQYTADNFLLAPYISVNEDGACVTIECKDIVIVPLGYSIASWNAIGKGFTPRSWILEADLNGRNRTVLYEHTDDKTIDKTTDFGVWRILMRKGPFNKFYLRQTGPNLLGTNNFQLTHFEVYGRVLCLNSVKTVPGGSANNKSFHLQDGTPTPISEGIRTRLPPDVFELPPCPPMEVVQTKGKRRK